MSINTRNKQQPTERSSAGSNNTDQQARGSKTPKAHAGQPDHDEQSAGRTNTGGHGMDIDEDLDREFNRQDSPNKEHGDTKPGTLEHR